MSITHPTILEIIRFGYPMEEKVACCHGCGKLLPKDDGKIFVDRCGRHFCNRICKENYYGKKSVLLEGEKL